MARTINGNYTGAAARIAHAEEFNNHILSIIAEKHQQFEALKLDLGDALNELRILDPKGWEIWFDNNDNIPDNGNYTEHLELIRKRIVEIRLQTEQKSDIMEPSNHDEEEVDYKDEKDTIQSIRNQFYPS